MPNLTLAIDAATARHMKLHPEIRWTEVARQAIQLKLRELNMLDAAFAHSKLTPADVGRMAKEANKRLLRKLRDGDAA